MENLKFDFVFLGQSVLKYQVPLDIFTTINQIYEQNFHNLAPANGQLVGKIENEHSLFYHGADQTKMKNHNMLPRNITDYFMTIFKHYLAFNKIIKSLRKFILFNFYLLSIRKNVKTNYANYVYYNWLLCQ